VDNHLSQLQAPVAADSIRLEKLQLPGLPFFNEKKLVAPTEPRFPKTVLIAGILWIIFGGWGLLLGGLMIAAGGPFQSPVSFWSVVFGGACVYVGIHTVRGTARGMWGNAIGSILFATFALIRAFSIVARARPQQGLPTGTEVGETAAGKEPQTERWIRFGTVANARPTGRRLREEM